MAKKLNYTITMLSDADEFILDIDDLYGIIQQLDALSQGYEAMDFSIIVIEETEEWIKPIVQWSNTITN